MQRELKGIDLTRREVVLSDAVAGAIQQVRQSAADTLTHTDRKTGWTAAYSLHGRLAFQTADFIIFSALTTVARRPASDVSWTQNWPYEPIVGNAPTASTFIWTWANFAFTFFCFGLVLFIYVLFLNEPDDEPMDPVLGDFLPLTRSQRNVGKFFLLVAVLLLVQIGAGTIMAVYEHGYAYARSSAFYETTRFWQWMRVPGDIAFATAAILMPADFILKLTPLYPRVGRLLGRKHRISEIEKPTPRGFDSNA